MRVLGFSLLYLYTFRLLRSAKDIVSLQLHYYPIVLFISYSGPERLHAELSLQFTRISWREDFHDPESADYIMLQQNLRDEVCK